MRLKSSAFVACLRYVQRHPVYHEAPARFALRALWFLGRERLGGRQTAFRACGGCRFLSPRFNYSSFVTATFGQRDLNIVRFWHRSLAPGSIFFDIGANIGLYTVAASRQVGPNGRVVGFEAHPAIFRYLAGNVARNCDGNVVIENVAVGAETGSARIAFGATNPGETHVAGPGEAGELVPVVTLDAYCARNGIRRVDYVKIDVEGYEPYVLRGAERTVKDNREILIQTEYEPRHLGRYGSAAELSGLLTGWGFRPYRIDWAEGAAEALSSLENYRGELIWSRRDLSGNDLDPAR